MIPKDGVKENPKEVESIVLNDKDHIICFDAIREGITTTNVQIKGNSRNIEEEAHVKRELLRKKGR